MPITPLVAAVRHNDGSVVSQLLAAGADVNEYCEVEPAIPRRQELPVYKTTPLFEAVRQRNKEIVLLLLERPELDVNKTAVSQAVYGRMRGRKIKRSARERSAGARACKREIASSPTSFRCSSGPPPPPLTSSRPRAVYRAHPP